MVAVAGLLVACKLAVIYQLFKGYYIIPRVIISWMHDKPNIAPPDNPDIYIYIYVFTSCRVPTVPSFGVTRVLRAIQSAISPSSDPNIRVIRVIMSCGGMSLTK